MLAELRLTASKTAVQRKSLGRVLQPRACNETVARMLSKRAGPVGLLSRPTWLYFRLKPPQQSSLNALCRGSGLNDQGQLIESADRNVLRRLANKLVCNSMSTLVPSTIINSLHARAVAKRLRPSLAKTPASTAANALANCCLFAHSTTVLLTAESKCSQQ